MNLSLLTKLPLQAASAATVSSVASGTSFANAIGSAISAVESSQQNAKTAALNLLNGGQAELHNVALISQKAELSLELFQQVRNKFVSAYQEIMKMPM